MILRHMILRACKEDQGVLAFEWILLTTLLTVGIVGGLSTVRDAMISELEDVAQATLALDQSYTIEFPLRSYLHTEKFDGGSDSSFEDENLFFHCDRSGFNGDLTDPAVNDASGNAIP